jgi:MerR family copper efflux transcriptional regulator
LELLTEIGLRCEIECGLEAVSFALEEWTKISGRMADRLQRCLRPKAEERTNILTLECIPGLILLMVQNSSSTTLRSGALAKATGLSPDSIRHYERIGVLPRASRKDSGYRVYPASAVERVLVVQRALRIGFTLAELAEVLKARDAGGAPCRRVYKLAQEKLKGIEADLEALKRTKRYVQKVLADWEQRIQRTGAGQKSHLLYSLSDAVMKSGAPANKFRRRKKP